MGVELRIHRLYFHIFNLQSVYFLLFRQIPDNEGKAEIGVQAEMVPEGKLRSNPEGGNYLK